jgi:ornithine cyclodeaminase/alanine dehydrogenase-like protein (mu-crystallin family)
VAKLEQLYPDFMSMSEVEQTEFIRAYRNKRITDLQEVTNYTAKKNTARLTDDEKALLKSLGISAKDLIALKSLTGGDQEDEEEEDTDVIPGIDDD